jgi:ferric-dicitrate binding protein FerR (iron transport regulator)
MMPAHTTRGGAWPAQPFGARTAHGFVSTVFRYRHFSVIPGIQRGRMRDPNRLQSRIESGVTVMKAMIRTGCVVLACAFFPIKIVVAQPANGGCSSANVTATVQTLRCEGGVIIVAESGARFTLMDRDNNGRVDSVELSSKALLLEVPKRRGGKEYRVITPQAIAAVRGTKWAVDAAENKTSVFVVNGQVAVGRRTGGHGVILGPGEGVDVEAATPLTVKRWPEARVSALMARLGQ